VIPAFFGIPPRVAIAIPSLAFCLWSRQLFRGGRISTKRTVVACSVAAVLSAADFAAGWRHGLEDQGSRYTLTTALISLAFAAIIAGMLILWRRRFSPRRGLAVNFFLFAWVFTYAFPYLGELP